MKNETKVISRQETIKNIFSLLLKQWPNAKCELNHNTPFQLLIAVVLSAQATDKSVNKALEPLLLANPKFCPTDLISLGEEGFLAVIKSIGLARTKAKNCYRLANILVSKYNSEVPLQRNDLESLPGVGRKTANVVLNVLCNLPTMAVDTHVERVSQRIGLVQPTKDRLKIENELLKKIPDEFAVQAHHLLIFQGRYHCTARNPKCVSCPITDLCLKVNVTR